MAVHRAGARRRGAGVDNVALLADLYHLVRMGEDPIAVIDRHAKRFGHVQIADVPGRGRPGTGDIPYPTVLRALERSGYAGHVGLEHKPAGPSAAEFGWLRTGDTTEETV